MKFLISRESLLKPLNLVAGVVERRHTLPVLANVLLQLDDGQLSLTGTDLEVELVGRVAVDDSSVDGEVTVPARKLLDICKSLPDGSVLEFSSEQQRAVLKSGRSRFTLATLPASEFPNIEDKLLGDAFDLVQTDLKRVLDHTMFAMAQQDVRYYLNGMLWEMQGRDFKVVATDGHRLAMATLENALSFNEGRQVILPRKGVMELNRLLQDKDEIINILVGTSHLRATTPEFTFSSKLVDGKFPDYQRVLPRNTDKQIVAEREELRSSLARAAILSNEKYHGVRLQMSDNELTIVASNPEQEEAEETLSIDYSYAPLEIGFNVSYLLDVMAVIPGDKVKISLSDANSSALVEDHANAESVYVVMPMRL
jgi:DNA polymerase-3 subunit beta